VRSEGKIESGVVSVRMGADKDVVGGETGVEGD
jgi:hypothetical protein